MVLRYSVVNLGERDDQNHSLLADSPTLLTSQMYITASFMCVPILGDLLA